MSTTPDSEPVDPEDLDAPAATADPSTARRVGAAVGRAAGSAANGTRELIRRNPTANRVYRTGVGVVGGGTVALGVVMMPLPGPGTLIALGGLGILASEFEGAKKVSRTANRVAKRAFDAAKDARARRRAESPGPDAARGPAAPPHGRRASSPSSSTSRPTRNDSSASRSSSPGGSAAPRSPGASRAK